MHAYPTAPGSGACCTKRTRRSSQRSTVRRVAVTQSISVAGDTFENLRRRSVDGSVGGLVSGNAKIWAVWVDFGMTVTSAVVHSVDTVILFDETRHVAHRDPLAPSPTGPKLLQTSKFRKFGPVSGDCISRFVTLNLVLIFVGGLMFYKIPFHW